MRSSSIIGNNLNSIETPESQPVFNHFASSICKTQTFPLQSPAIKS
jgi:hypothetical protein